MLTAPGLLLTVRAVRRLVTREVAFAVGATGVFLGRDRGTPAERVPWQAIDEIATFSDQVSDEQHRFVAVRRTGQTVTARRIHGWAWSPDADRG